MDGVRRAPELCRLTTKYANTRSKNFSSFTSSSNTSGSPDKLTKIVRTCSAIFYTNGCQFASWLAGLRAGGGFQLTGWSLIRSLRFLIGFSSSALKIAGSVVEKGTRFSAAARRI